MKNKFGLWPKIALFVFLAAMTFQKFQAADNDLKPDKSGQAVELQPTATLPVAYAQVATTDTLDVGDPDRSGNGSDSGGLWAIIKQNWGLVVTALLGLLEVIVRLTPTEKDNSVFNFLKFLLDKIIPNRSQEGGAH